ncbi:MAG TPA: hypothetical protein VNI55_01395 [Gaiellaceae bacterium]|nr:hypothetical protein [Gaiellaceae bacterium]
MEDELDDALRALATLHNVRARLDAMTAELAVKDEALRRGRAAIFAHHEMGTLSDKAIRESIGGTCQICARALAALASPEQEPEL